MDGNKRIDSLICGQIVAAIKKFTVAATWTLGKKKGHLPMTRKGTKPLAKAQPRRKALVPSYKFRIGFYTTLGDINTRNLFVFCYPDTNDHFQT